MAIPETTRPSTRLDNVFRSVFQPPTETTLEKAFFASDNGVSKETSAAWNIVTEWLRLPREVNDPAARIKSGLDHALSCLLSNLETTRRLVDWLSNEAQEHQNLFLKPKLQALWQLPILCSHASSVLSQTLDLLILSHERTLRALDQWLVSHHRKDQLTHAVAAVRSTTVERIYANALHILPAKRLFKTLSFILHASICNWLLSSDPSSSLAHAENTLALLDRIRRSGLGGDSGQRALAHAMNAVVDTYVQSSDVKVDWVSKQGVTGRLRIWIRERFVPVARDCVKSLTGQRGTTFFDSETTEWESVALEKIAKQRIKYLFEYVRAWDHSTGAILDLKEYIHTATDGKLLLANSFGQQLAGRMLHAGVATAELLSMYISVICAFKALDPRGVLLDKVAVPLRSYLRQREDTVRIIAASFLADVDADGRVSNPSDEVCSDLAREIALSEGEDIKVDDRGLDWDDMAWVPDPIDAGPDYKKAKSDDIMAFMLTLFERNDFIQEVQTLLGERLLSTETADSELDKEIRLVELFKTRFGPDGLQSCEVMLRDILDSRRINTTLRPRDETAFPTIEDIHAAVPGDGITMQGLISIFRSRLPPGNSTANRKFISLARSVTVSDDGNGMLLAKAHLPPSTEKSPDFSTSILSSFFWPSLREDEFHVPGPINDMQKAYEADFERIKNMRKLQWLSALGRVTVELELEDRTVEMEAVQTWQASVIYAFQDDSAEDSNNSAVTKTVQELEDLLSMDEMLVRNAIAFWIGQRVLVEKEPDTYAVLERLPTAEEERAAPTQAPAPAQPDAAISAVKSQDAVLQDNKGMYELFMVGMLTNGGAMDAARITMMMKMVVPGGYAFGEDETKWLLAGMVEQGKVVENGSSFAVKR